VDGIAAMPPGRSANSVASGLLDIARQPAFARNHVPTSSKMSSGRAASAAGLQQNVQKPLHSPVGMMSIATAVPEDSFDRSYDRSFDHSVTPSSPAIPAGFIDDGGEVWQEKEVTAYHPNKGAMLDGFKEATPRSFIRSMPEKPRFFPENQTEDGGYHQITPPAEYTRTSPSRGPFLCGTVFKSGERQPGVDIWVQTDAQDRAGWKVETEGHSARTPRSRSLHSPKPEYPHHGYKMARIPANSQDHQHQDYESVQPAYIDEHRKHGGKRCTSWNPKIGKHVAEVVFGTAVDNNGEITGKQAETFDGHIGKPSWIVRSRGKGTCSSEQHRREYEKRAFSADEARIAGLHRDEMETRVSSEGKHYSFHGHKSAGMHSSLHNTDPGDLGWSSRLDALQNAVAGVCSQGSRPTRGKKPHHRELFSAPCSASGDGSQSERLDRAGAHPKRTEGCMDEMFPRQSKLPVPSAFGGDQDFSKPSKYGAWPERFKERAGFGSWHTRCPPGGVNITNCTEMSREEQWKAQGKKLGETHFESKSRYVSEFQERNDRQRRHVCTGLDLTDLHDQNSPINVRPLTGHAGLKRNASAPSGKQVKNESVHSHLGPHGSVKNGGAGENTTDRYCSLRAEWNVHDGKPPWYVDAHRVAHAHAQGHKSSRSQSARREARGHSSKRLSGGRKREESGSSKPVGMSPPTSPGSPSSPESHRTRSKTKH